MKIDARIAGTDLILNQVVKKQFDPSLPVADDKYVNTFDSFVEKVKFLLERNEISADVYYRIKSAFSTREKMRTSGGVHDLFIH